MFCFFVLGGIYAGFGDLVCPSLVCIPVRRVCLGGDAPLVIGSWKRGGGGVFVFVSGTLSSSPIDVISSASMTTLLFFDSCTFFFSSKTVVTMSLLVKNEEKSKNVFLLTKIIVRRGLALLNDH